MMTTENKTQSCKSSINDKNALICKNLVMQRVLNQYTRLENDRESDDKSNKNKNKRKLVLIFG